MRNDQQRALVLQKQLNEFVTEKAALSVECARLEKEAALAENADLKAAAEAAKAKSLSEQNFIALIRRRAAKLAAQGQGYEALLLLKKYGA